MEEIISLVKLLLQDLGHVAWPSELLDPVWIIWIVLTVITVIIVIYWMFCGVNHKDRAQKFENHALRMREKAIVLTEEKKELCEALIESKDRIESLEKKNSEQYEQIKAASKAKAEVDKENVTLKEECAKKGTELAKKDTDLNKIKSELSCKKTDLIKLAEQLRIMGIQKEKIEEHSTEQLERLEKEKDQLKEEMERFILEKDQVSTENNKLKEQIRYVASLQEEIVAKDTELKALKDCAFLLMSPAGDEPSVNELKDIKDFAKIQQLKEQIAEFENKLEEEEENRLEMNASIENLKEEIEKVKESEIKARQFGEDSLKKLQILSDYFSDQEQELIKNVEDLDEAKIEASVKFTLESEKTAMLETQLESYRVQVAELKKEIVNSDEQARKMVHRVEQRAHDNWLAARRAEEDLRDLLDRRIFQGPPPFGPPPMGHRPSFSPRGPPHSFERGDNLCHPPPQSPLRMMPPKNLSLHQHGLSNLRSVTSSPRSAASSPRAPEIPQPSFVTPAPRAPEIVHPSFVTPAPRAPEILQPSFVTPAPRAPEILQPSFVIPAPRAPEIMQPSCVTPAPRAPEILQPSFVTPAPRAPEIPQPSFVTPAPRAPEILQPSFVTPAPRAPEILQPSFVTPEIPQPRSVTSSPRSEKTQLSSSIFEQSQENDQQNYYIPTPQPDEVKPFPGGVNVTPIATETPSDDFFISIV